MRTTVREFVQEGSQDWLTIIDEKWTLKVWDGEEKIHQRIDF